MSNDRWYLLEHALLAQGWAGAVRVSVAADGMITAIDTTPAGAPAAAERVRGFVVPGMSNAHSHAFQRGMVGRTEYRRSARDSFWTWREAMYALANRIAPEELELIATQLFIEMLKAGYTGVAEFHYLHRQPGGALYGAPDALWSAVERAAERTGIALTLLPTLYQTSDFGAQPLKAEQARFHLDTEPFVAAIGARLHARGTSLARRLRTGAAFHSLRAVPPDALEAAARALRSLDARLPIHIHVAEQVKEVEACLASTGRRPIERLLDFGVVDAHWCLVHATHATPAEITAIARTGAMVCVSITTEANLGDGFFDATRFLAAGGRLCVGSDSQASVSPTEELRWLEYQARLRKRRRAALADRAGAHVGTRLWTMAAEHGAAALGQPAGRLEVGRRADWVVLDPDHPALAGAAPENVLDHLVFGGSGAGAIREVWVAGRRLIEAGRHALEAETGPPFRALMERGWSA
jgi:formimidoylglutamate deiminase